MEAIAGILKEEITRLKAAEKSYLRELKRLPKGSVQKKKIKGIAYSYLAFRSGRKVIYRYLGDLSESELNRLGEKIKLRRKYEAQLRQVRKDKGRLTKIVHGKRRTI